MPSEDSSMLPRLAVTITIAALALWGTLWIAPTAISLARLIAY